jgi:hypothetical protein
VRETEVIYVKKFAATALAATAAASILSTATAAPSLVINDGEASDIQTFSYVADAGGLASTLKVNTPGYVFCANVGTTTATPISMQPLHDRWTLASATDIPTVRYNGGVLSINKQVETSLACQVRGPYGELRSPFSGFGDMLFRDSWEGLLDQQFDNLVNWQPVPAFTWSAADWTQVPNDSCTWDLNPNVPVLSEDSLCAAAAGVRPVAGNSQNDARYGDRAPTMWTQSTTSKFIYLARIDARFGSPNGAPNSHFPQGAQGPNQQQSSTVDIAIRDAYDSNYLSASGTYCLLRQLPATLDDNVCSSGDVYFSKSLIANPGGIVSERIPLSLGFTQAASLFIAVVRSKSTDLPPRCQPAAAIAVLADPVVSRHEAGDEFIGDDVAFGFYGNEQFPWMGACP